MAEPKRVVVTGGAGFIGSHVARALLRMGAQVRILAGPPAESRTIDFATDACLYADIADSSRLESLFAGARTVVHAAGPPSVTDSFDHAAEYMRVHAVGTAAVLEACLRTGVKRIVYISSAEVYGNSGESYVCESRPMTARSPYGAAKIGAEQLVSSFALAGVIEGVLLRPFSVYGPGMSQVGVVAQILAQAASGSRIEIRDARPERDFCYVTDVARAVVAACTVRVDRLAIVNLGSGVATSIGEVACLAAELAGAPGVMETGATRPADGEILRLIADTRTGRDLLNWQASTSLREGLAKTLEWTRAQ